jgi:hypothetical protein
MADPNIQRVCELLAAYMRGDEGSQQWLGQWTEAWAEERFELGKFVEVDESVLVVEDALGAAQSLVAERA